VQSQPRAGAAHRDRVASPSRIPITKPLFGAEELAAVQRPLETGWVVQGPFVAEFEQKLGTFTGASHAVATSSCTTALHIAVASLGLAPGDRVVVPAFTWVSTANVVEYMGATPVFVDIDLPTFNVDPAAMESAVDERTVGLLPVHLFGLCAELDPILACARRRGLWVVEDAACALGARYRGRHAGTLGDAGCFSFHPRKSITTGEGGMLTTEREELAALARSLRDHGATRSDLSRHTEAGAFLLSDYPYLGYNYRMTDLQGALGSVQLDRAGEILAARAGRAQAYDEALADVDWLATPVVPEGHVHGRQAYVCLFRPEDPTAANADRLNELRNRLMARLEERGVSTRQGTHAPVLTEYYAKRYGLRPEDFPAAYLADRLSLALPLYPQMTDEEQEVVVSELQSAWRTI
jgi:perosamine synthetase